MNWFEIINKSTKYIEDNITSEIILENIAKEVNVSYYHFSRIFALMTGYGLKEYITNRRITLASYEVSYTKERIIDIAFRYGYNSNESFSRAFKRIHGINPSEARENKVTVYTFFPALKYDVPDQNLISLRYEIIDDINDDFYGKETYIKEGEYEETQRVLNEFDQMLAKELLIKDICSYEPTIYKVRHHIIENPLFEYHYLVGFKKNQNQEIKIKNSISVEIRANKAVKFISRSITKEMIPKIKKIIYEEWLNNLFEIDGVCEIEYTQLNDIKKLDFFYIVSIK